MTSDWERRRTRNDPAFFAQNRADRVSPSAYSELRREFTVQYERDNTLENRERILTERLGPIVVFRVPDPDGGGQIAFFRDQVFSVKHNLEPVGHGRTRSDAVSTLFDRIIRMAEGEVRGTDKEFSFYRLFPDEHCFKKVAYHTPGSEKAVLSLNVPDRPAPVRKAIEMLNGEPVTEAPETAPA